MKELIVKKFIKNSNNIENDDVREKHGILGGVIGVISNLILVVSKIIIGILSSSISVIADAINNLSDFLSNIITVVGFKMSNKKADDDHPFGHKRVEYIISLIICIIIIIIGGKLLIDSIKSIINKDSVEFNYISIIVLGISIVIKGYQASWYFFLGKRINSISLKASGRDSINDCISTFAVLISALVFFIWKINIDSYVGILVSIFIVYSGIKLLLESASPLIGELPSKELVDKMLDILLKPELILGYHDLIIHSYGPNTYYSTIHLEFDYKKDILEVHELIDALEKIVFDKLNIILTVHMDPIIVDDEEIKSLKEKMTSFIKSINGEYNLHDFRLVRGKNRSNVLFDCTITDDVDKAILKEKLQAYLTSIDPKYHLIVVIERELKYKE